MIKILCLSFFSPEMFPCCVLHIWILSTLNFHIVDQDSANDRSCDSSRVEVNVAIQLLIVSFFTHWLLRSSFEKLMTLVVVFPLCE